MSRAHTRPHSPTWLPAWLTARRGAAGLAEALSDGGAGLDAGAVLRLPPP